MVSCLVGDVVDIDRLGDRPIHTAMLSRDHIAVSAVSQFSSSYGIGKNIGNTPKQEILSKTGSFQNHKVSQADRSSPAVFWIPPAYRLVRRKAQRQQGFQIVLPGMAPS